MSKDPQQPAINAAQQLKHERKQALGQLRQRFQQQQVADSLLFWSNTTDRLLNKIWLKMGLAQLPVSLIAIGGYGRQELFPQSDVDILIISPENINEIIQQAISLFLQACWDTGFAISHRVEDIHHCLAFAKDDLVSYTALLEARLITGNSQHYEQLMLQVMNETLWSKKQFIQQKLAEHNKRFAKYDAASYKLEPSIKNSAGGLRDIHLIDWLSIKCFNTNSLKNLVELNGLSQQEYFQLISSRYFLWKVRLALHLLTQRTDDRLLFDYQYDIACELGYQTEHRETSIEAFMQEVYCHLRIININSRQFIKWLSEQYLFDKKQQQQTIINDKFKIINQHIAARSPQLFQHDPAAMLELFLNHAKHQCQGIRAKTVRLLQLSKPLIDTHYLQQKPHQIIFINILQQPHNVAHTLRLMSQHGILSAYIPAFNNTIGRMQYDLFHTYTVDHHTLLLIHYLERFADKDNQPRFPLCHSLFKAFKQRYILYIAGLFHDIAKGLPGDHSTVGEQLANDFCLRHHLADNDRQLITWLVKHHLLLSITAQRRDISDKDVIRDFAKQVKHRHYLNALYLLTVADIRATNQTLWTSWKETLIQQLYYNCREHLDKKPRNQVQLIKDRKIKVLNQFSSTQQKKLKTHWQRLGNSYFLSYRSDTIAWHMQKLLTDTQQDARLLVSIRKHDIDNVSEVFIYMPDRPNIFSTAVSVFDKFGLNVIAAQIITTKDSYCLDTFRVTCKENTAIEDIHLSHDLQQQLQYYLNTEQIVKRKRRPDRLLRHFTPNVTVNFIQTKNKKYTLIELFTLDFPGLLAELGKIFMSFKLNLIMAKITTLGEKVEDIFYVTSHDHQPLTDLRLQEDIRQRITDRFLHHD